MTERFDICQGKPKKDGGTFWHKIGTAWPMDGGKMRLVFDSLPTPTMDEQYGLKLDAVVFPAKDKPGSIAPTANVDSKYVGDAPLDDNIPF
jgi:hypothetical protein